MLQVHQLIFYPVKSLAGISADEVELTDRGFKHDRRFMLVDEQHVFLSQRDVPAMALFRTLIQGEKLQIWQRSEPEDRLEISLDQDPSTGRVVARVWDDFVNSQYVSEEADHWFSSKLDLPCRMVYMPDNSQRNVDSMYALNKEITSYSDGFPYLLIGESSLQDLNRRMESPLPMNRFRPNIVMSGGNPYEEDAIAQFSIHDLNFFIVKPCARCVTTTTDQETGHTGKEPLKTLAGYRMWQNKVYFGQNVLCDGEGKIRVGDEIRVIAVRSPMPPL